MALHRPAGNQEDRGRRDAVLIVAGATAAAVGLGLARGEHWVSAGLCGGLGAFWSVAGWRRPKLRPPVARAPRLVIPICQVCGYDLRATPHRCPECGTPVTQPRLHHG